MYLWGIRTYLFSTALSQRLKVSNVWLRNVTTSQLMQLTFGEEECETSPLDSNENHSH